MAASRVRIPWVALFGYVPSFGVGMFGILAPVTYVTIDYRPQVFLFFFFSRTSVEMQGSLRQSVVAVCALNQSYSDFGSYYPITERASLSEVAWQLRLVGREALHI